MRMEQFKILQLLMEDGEFKKISITAYLKINMGGKFRPQTLIYNKNLQIIAETRDRAI